MMLWCVLFCVSVVSCTDLYIRIDDG